MIPTPESSILIHSGRETLSTKRISPSLLWGTVFYALTADNHTVKILVVIVNWYV
jgi:hypothetical protein